MLFVNFFGDDVDWFADVFFCQQVVVKIEVFDVDGCRPLPWIGDGFVEEDFHRGKIGCFGGYISHVIDEVASDSHSHLIRIFFLLAESCNDTNVCWYDARW